LHGFGNVFEVTLAPGESHTLSLDLQATLT